MLQLRGPVVTSDAGLLAYPELDNALGLSVLAGATLADARCEGETEWPSYSTLTQIVRQFYAINLKIFSIPVNLED